MKTFNTELVGFERRHPKSNVFYFFRIIYINEIGQSRKLKIIETFLREPITRYLY